MTILPTSCKKCGKPLNLFDGAVCGECERGTDMTAKQAIDIIKCLAWHKRPSEEEIEDAIKALEQTDELLDYVNQSIEAEKKAMSDYHDLASEEYHKGIIYAFERMKMKLM